ncbi:hypothetical protein DF032_34720 [Burkholderia seminalis]|nr:hypothetical protein DF032_34720 [Burkholderia seminalis]
MFLSASAAFRIASILLLSRSSRGETTRMPTSTATTPATDLDRISSWPVRDLAYSRRMLAETGAVDAM